MIVSVAVILHALKVMGGKIRSWCRHSLTIGWARLQYVGGVVGGGVIVAFSGYDLTQLAMLDTKSAFKVLLALAMAGLLTELARRRTLPKE